MLLKEYTVTEAATILIEEGVIRRGRLVNRNKNGAAKLATGEPQVRLWIREYNKAFQEKYNEQISLGDDHEKAEKYAHAEAARHGIKASMQSRRTGYRITEHDLKEFIVLKLGSNKERKLIQELNTHKKEKIIEIEKEKGKMKAEWFAKGFQSAINYFEQNFILNQDPLSKEIISLPKKGWFVDENSIKATRYKMRQTENSILLWVDFKNKQIEQLHFKLKIYRSYHQNKEVWETKIDWGIENAILSTHYRVELENLLSDKVNISIIKQVLSDQIPKNEENKLAILILLSS